MSLTFLFIIFFLIAALYASVGFGGGSSYIAILLILGIAMPEVRFTALICNIIVVGSSTINFYRHKMIPWRKVIPIIVLSVPAAFIGGTMQLQSDIYKTIASVSLIIAAILMLINTENSKKSNHLPPLALTGLGGGIGFLSGIIGIGGGIFLAPILHLIRWETAKTISITASLFILFNSSAGLLGQASQFPEINTIRITTLGFAVLIGGVLGNRLNIHILKASHLRIITAILISIVGIRILFSQII